MPETVCYSDPILLCIAGGEYATFSRFFLPDVSVRVCQWEPVVRLGGWKQVEEAPVLPGTQGSSSSNNECWLLGVWSLQSSNSSSFHGKDSFVGSYRSLLLLTVPDLWISLSNSFSSYSSANTFASVVWNIYRIFCFSNWTLIEMAWQENKQSIKSLRGITRKLI